ncbi:MAG TPA: ATP-binding protein [Syntrophobacteraceae bacterium]|nr:ATP-binding protein [Syntrophobacteraceae bacterium]
MPVRSIRARLTFWYALTFTAALLVLGAAAYGLLSYSLSRQIDASLNGVAQALTEKSRGGAAGLVPSEVDEVFRRFFGFSPWDPYLQFLDPSGRRDPREPPARRPRLPLSSRALENASMGLPTYETIEGLESGPIRLLTLPRTEGGRVAGLIQVGTSLQGLRETRFRFMLIMAGLLPLGLLLAAGGGRLLARRALSPVDRMTEAARHISAEHLTEQLEQTGTGDELDRLAATLNDMLKRLDASFRQIRQFSADASHELQTPLTILKGEVEVALRAPRSAEEYVATLESALEEIDRIARLVDGLLTVSRAQAGVLRMDTRPVDLARLLEGELQRLGVLAHGRSVELVSGFIEPLTIPGDAARLQQLFANLLENGLKYTPAGGTVTLSLARNGNWAVTEISDTGIGIDPREREKIFQPFYRTTQARNLGEKGVGLGLSIVQSIAQAHGGKVEVLGHPGRGSTFKVFLPV